MGRGSKPGERRGGRKAGVPNKRHLALREATNRALASGEAITPQEFMLSLVNNRELDLALRLEAAKSVAQFVHPKLSAVHNLNETKAQYWIAEAPLSESEWEAEFTGPIIEGRAVPMAQTVAAVHKLETEVRDKRISQLEEQLRMAEADLAAAAQRERDRLTIPLLS